MASMDSPLLLIIDDEEYFCELLSAFFEDYGFSVLTATQGNRGIELFDESKPDIVLLDLHIPEVHGLKILKYIKEYSENTPVIVISGTGDINDVVEALRLGAWDYIIKPIRGLEFLHHSVKRNIERSRLIKDNKLYQEELEEKVQRRTAELNRANSELLQINERLRRIVETTREISRHTELREFLKSLLEEYAILMSAQGGSVYLFEKGVFNLVSSLDPGHAPESVSLHSHGESVFNKLIMEKEPLLIQDIDKYKYIKTSGWKGYSHNSFLAFPLLDVKNSVAALISLHNKTDPPFVEQDKEIGAILSSYCCQALSKIKTNEALRISEEKYRKLFNNAIDAIYLWRLNDDGTFGECIEVNSVASSMSGYSKEELLALTPGDLFDESSGEKLHEIADRLLKEGFSSDELIYVAKDKNRIPVEINSHMFRLQDKDVVLSISRDITSRKLAETRIISSLKEKEIMLKEIHHRVKNNMQVISSLLDLQANYVLDDQYRKLFIESQKRVFSMALVHEMLYQSENFSEIDFGKYIKDLTGELFNTYRRDKDRINISIEAENIFISIDNAIPCALIINELVSNSLKYAFSGKEHGSLKIKFVKESGDFILTVVDNGIGLPEDFNIEESKSLGLHLVDALVTQLRASLDIKTRNGTEFVIKFPSGNHSDYSCMSSRNGAASAQVKSKIRVIIVEDENVTAEYIKKILISEGFDVLKIFDCGEDAAAFINENRPDMIIMDIFLSGKINGFETYEIIKKKHLIPVIFSSVRSRQFEDHKAENFNKKGMEYIDKPVTRSRLLSAINRIIADR